MKNLQNIFSLSTQKCSHLFFIFSLPDNCQQSFCSGYFGFNYYIIVASLKQNIKIFLNLAIILLLGISSCIVVKGEEIFGGAIGSGNLTPKGYVISDK